MKIVCHSVSMKSSRIIAILLSLISASCSYFPSQAISAANPIPNQILVKYKEGYTPAQIKKMAKERQSRQIHIHGKLLNFLEDVQNNIKGNLNPEIALLSLTEIESTLDIDTSTQVTYTTPTLELLHFRSNTTAVIASDQLKQLPFVEYAHPNYQVELASLTPNDPLFAQQWNLQKINTQKGWDLASEEHEVKIAIIDTGINQNHQDINQTRLVLRKNFINGSNNPTDATNGHGSHITGIIGATTNNSLGISGIDNYSKLYIYKIADNSATLNNLIAALNLALEDKVNVINLSLGFYLKCSQVAALQEVFNRLYQANISIITAAGNGSTNVSGYSPASCNHIISVGSTNQNDQRSSFSNFGSLVTLSAPGGQSSNPSDSSGTILGISGTSNTQYSSLIGTSQAAPHVSAAAALLLSKNPNLTPDQIKNILVSSGDAIQTDQPIGPRLNLYKALQQVSPSNPPATNTQTPLLTDLDGDHDTDYKDLRLLINNYSKSGTGDLNNSGKVDSFDFSKLLQTI